MTSEHYKYLRGLLPPIPHIVEKLSFTDLNSWGCCLNLALLTQSDCMKWLTDFQEITKTSWKMEKVVKSVGNLQLTWGAIYRCSPCNVLSNNNSQKVCTARLEMKLAAMKPGKQYPCTVNIHFYHNHKTLGANNVQDTVITAAVQQPQPIVTQATAATVRDASGQQQQPQQVYQIQEVSLLPMKDQMESFVITNNMEGITLQQQPAQQPGQGQQALMQTLEIPQAVPDQQLCNPHETIVLSDNNLIVPTSNLSRDAIPEGSPQTKRFYQVVQELWGLLQRGGESTLAVDNFTKEFMTHKAMPSESSLLKALTNFGKIQTMNKMINGSGGALPNKVQTSKRKAVRRTRCGSCKGCQNFDRLSDCKECRNCLDQKRYGGPGKLKKACLRRLSCDVACKGGPVVTATVQAPPTTAQTVISTPATVSLPTEIALPLHPVPLSAISTVAASASFSAPVFTQVQPAAASTVILPSPRL